MKSGSSFDLNMSWGFVVGIEVEEEEDEEVEEEEEEEEEEEGNEEEEEKFLHWLRGFYGL